MKLPSLKLLPTPQLNMILQRGDFASRRARRPCNKTPAKISRALRNIADF
jgi:hypothetical protein